MELLLSKSTMFLVKYFALAEGWLMNGIYEVLNLLGIQNLGLTIIFFTIIIYMLMTPLQVKQQKSSKYMAVVQPELTRIQEKYKGKTDQASQMKMNEETQAAYKKYGISPMGSCSTLLIQMPLLFGIYQVILYIPGYISKVADVYSGLAAEMMNISGISDLVTAFVSENKMRVSLGSELTTEKVIDFLYTLKPAQWTKLGEMSEFSSLSAEMADVAQKSSRINAFLGINIADAPWDAIKTGFSAITGGTATTAIILAMIVAILIPFLAWFTQWINMKLMPQQGGGNDQMSQQMKTMNTFMPLFSAYICVTLSMGLGIYWIFGAVVRMIQQIIINRSLSNIDVDKMIAEAQEKAAAKAEKEEKARKDYASNVTQNARTNVKRIQNEKSNGKDIDSSQFYRNAEDLNPDSITAKANWVKAFDEKNSRKKK